MAGNISDTSHTKHVDIGYKNVNEYVEDEIVKTVFAKSAENDSDIFAKNLNGELNGKCTNKMIGEKFNRLPRFGDIQRKKEKL